MTQSSAAALIRTFLDTRRNGHDELGDRAALAGFLRAHKLIADGSVPIRVTDFDEAIALREGLRARLTEVHGGAADPDALAGGQRVLDGLRVTVRLEADSATGAPLAPAVVDEVRRGLARIAGAWAVALSAGEL